MKKIRSIIIDDEPGNIITLSGLLDSYCPEVEIVSTAPDPEIGYSEIQKHKPQVVFLDIEMPYGNAFDLLDRCSPVHFEVIFITAFNDYAIKAFKYSAADYLLKPVNITELQAAVKRVAARLQQTGLNSNIEFLLNNLKAKANGLQKIALPVMDGLVFEDISTLNYLIAEGSYTRAVFSGNRKQLVTRNLKEMEDLLPNDLFFRIHNSSLINLNFVKKYHKGRGGYVEMQDGASLEVAVRKKAEFLERFGVK